MHDKDIISTSRMESSPAFTYPADYKGDYVVFPGASVSPHVTFAEGCVVLRGARITVDQPCRLHFGAYCLVEEYAVIHVGNLPSSALNVSKTCAPDAQGGEVHIGAFTHFQSHASLTVDAPTSGEPLHGKCLCDILFGRGIVFAAFAALSVIVEDFRLASDASPEIAVDMIVGPHTHFMPYATLQCRVSGRKRAGPLVGPRQVVMRVVPEVEEEAPPSSAPLLSSEVLRSGTAVVPRGGVRSVAEVSAIVDYLHETQEQTHIEECVEKKSGPVSTPSRVSADAKIISSSGTATLNPHGPWRVMDRALQDDDAEMENDVKKRCRYYLAL